jgi:hypothetical protein
LEGAVVVLGYWNIDELNNLVGRRKRNRGERGKEVGINSRRK